MSRIPCHIAVIMDGNGRWAQQRGHERTYGHKAGLDAVRSVIEGAGEMGVKYLTLYTFSTENWNRPKEEVDMLMGLLAQSIHNELEELMAKHVRLLIQGQMQDLPESCREAMQSAIDQTANNDGLTLILALSYSGRTEIARAARAIAQEVSQGTLRVEDIRPDTVSQHLYHSEVPDPDVLIRTGGECRISNFLLWQMAYTEFFFVPVMWPDFRKEAFFSALDEFAKRDRRYGKVK